MPRLLEQTSVFEGHAVRWQDIGGETWWVAKDVCDALGVQNSRQHVADLDDDERGVSTVYTPSGNQNMAIVNEAGLYSLILRSRKPEAKRFKRWVTHDVLPSIRRTGSYSKAPEQLPLKISPGSRALELVSVIAENQLNLVAAVKGLARQDSLLLLGRHQIETLLVAEDARKDVAALAGQIADLGRALKNARRAERRRYNKRPSVRLARALRRLWRRFGRWIGVVPPVRRKRQAPVIGDWQ